MAEEEQTQIHLASKSTAIAMDSKHLERSTDLASIEALLTGSGAEILLDETDFAVEILAQVDRDPTLRCLYKICASYSSILATMKKLAEENSNMTSQIWRLEEEILSQPRQISRKPIIEQHVRDTQLRSSLEQNKILAFARTRPRSKVEIGSEILHFEAFTNMTCRLTRKNFDFDRVFSSTSTNLEVYREVSPVIQAALEGSNIAIVVDGQSGTSKSHTMFTGEHAIAPFATKQIFDWVSLMTA